MGGDITPPPLLSSVTSIQEMYTWMKKRISSLASKIESKAVSIGGKYFRILDNYITLSRNHVPDGNLQWVLDFVLYMQSVTVEVTTK